MIDKYFSPDGWNFGEQPTSLVKLSCRGLFGSDFTSFVKRAGEELAHQVRGLRLEDGEVPMHLLAMGSTEFWGSNRNGDGWKEAMLQRDHPTFVTNAHYYHDHKNNDPAKSYGKVKLAHYNRPMHRVELLVLLNGNEKVAKARGGLLAERDLEKLARNEDIPVSMACLTNPDYPILVKDLGYVRIVDVRVGDLVWTHKSRWRRVVRLNRRKYTGEVLEFSMNGLPFPLEVTADHLMWAKIFAGSRNLEAIGAKAMRFFKDPAAFEATPIGWEHASHIGIGDRFFYRPITRYESYGRIACKDLASIMGYYLAEGSFSFNGERACTTQFSCNLDDSAPRRIPQIMSRIYPDITVDLQPNHHSEAGLNVFVYHTGFSEFLRTQLGRGAKSKFIAPEIFNSVEEVKLAFLGAWLDGDGWCDKKGIHWSTASFNLVLQGRDLLASIGIPSSIYRIDHSKCETSGKPGSGIEYTLNVAHLDAWRLAGDSEKVAAYPAPRQQRTKPSCLRYCPDGTYAVRISDVKTRHVADCETYNFEVEEDESYSAAGLVSHNCHVPYDVCSSCSNRAKSRAEYCTEDTCIGSAGEKRGGCRQNLAKVAADGHLLHVDNPHGTFFDISGLKNKPADMNAYGHAADYLHKAADQLPVEQEWVTFARL